MRGGGGGSNAATAKRSGRWPSTVRGEPTRSGPSRAARRARVVARASGRSSGGPNRVSWPWRGRSGWATQVKAATGARRGPRFQLDSHQLEQRSHLPGGGGHPDRPAVVAVRFQIHLELEQGTGEALALRAGGGSFPRLRLTAQRSGSRVTTAHSSSMASPGWRQAVRGPTGAGRCRGPRREGVRRAWPRRPSTSAAGSRARSPISATSHPCKVADRAGRSGRAGRGGSGARKSASSLSGTTVAERAGPPPPARRACCRRYPRAAGDPAPLGGDDRPSGGIAARGSTREERLHAVDVRVDEVVALVLDTGERLQATSRNASRAERSSSRVAAACDQVGRTPRACARVVPRGRRRGEAGGFRPRRPGRRHRCPRTPPLPPRELRLGAQPRGERKQRHDRGRRCGSQRIGAPSPKSKVQSRAARFTYRFVLWVGGGTFDFRLLTFDSSSGRGHPHGSGLATGRRPAGGNKR